MTLGVVWITGASGFIGRHLAQHLCAGRERVMGLGHGSLSETEAVFRGLERWLAGDISASNLDSLRVTHGTPDVVFHLAGGSSVGLAIANPHEDFLRTVATTIELLEWMRQKAPKARLVATSSAAVYGDGHPGRIAEQCPAKPCSPYGYHKLMMELLCRSYGSTYGLLTVVPRLFSVYGPNLRKQLLWDLCTKLESGDARVELGGTGNELRDWTDVRDVVRAMVRAVSLASSEAPSLNIGTGVATAVRDIAAGLVNAWSAGDSRREVVFTGQVREGDPFSLLADTTTLDKLGFDWRIPLSRGLADYVRWFKSRSRGRL